MELTFVCNDADGNPHSYTLTPHRGSEGAPIAMRLLGLVVEPLALGAGPILIEGMGKLAGKGEGKGAAIAALLDDPDLLRALDLSALSRGVRQALMGLQPSLQYHVLRYVNRDGKPLISESAGDLRATGTFDSAYARNYLELGSALWQAAQLNGFFPGLSIIGELAKEAASAVQETTKKND